jgi:hypothetical protein
MVTKDTAKFDSFYWVSFYITILAAISIAASFNSQWHLWGLDSVRIFPVWLRLLLLAMLLAMTVPGIGFSIGQRISLFLSSLKNKQLSLIYFIMSIILVVLFVVFKSHNHFLGDGFTILGNIQKGRYFSPTEPLDYMIHYFLATMIDKGPSGVYLSYAYCAYACGVFFLLGLFLITKNKVNLIFSLCVVSAFAVMQFFFGYVESYTFRFVTMFLYSLSAVNNLRDGKISISTIFLFCLAVAFHISNIVLLPSLIYLLVMKYPVRRQWISFSASLAAGLLGFLAYVYFYGGLKINEIVTPLWSTSENPYTLFSRWHLADMVNLILLNSPLLLLAIPVGRLRRKLLSPFYLLLIGPSLIFILAIDPKIGALRDWDLLSLASAPVIVLLIDSLLLEKGRDLRRVHASLVVIGLFGLLHTGSWIYLNSTQQQSYNRVKEYVQHDIHYSDSYYKGYRDFSWGYLAAKFRADTTEFIRALQIRYNAAPEDSLSTSALATTYLLHADTAAALNLARSNLARFQGDKDVVKAFANIMVRARQFDEAERAWYGYRSLKGEDSDFYGNLGMIKSLRIQKDSSYYYLDKGYTLRPDSPIPEQYNLYVYCFMGGQYNLAQSGFNRILPRLMGNQKKAASNIIHVLDSHNAQAIDSLRNFVIRDVNKNKPR